MTEQSQQPERSWGDRSPEDDSTLFWVPLIIVVALIASGIGAVGQAVGWWTLFLATAATIVVAAVTILTVIVKRNNQDEAAEFDTAHNLLLPRFEYIDPSEVEMIEELLGITLRADEAPMRLVTEKEIDATGVLKAPLLPLHGDAEDDPVADYHGTYTAPKPARWKVFIRDVWLWLSQNWRWLVSFACWPISFWLQRTTRAPVTWANMTEADKHREAVVEATFRAEEVMWWMICLAFTSLVVYGWYQEDTWVSLAHVLGSYALSGAKIATALAFRRH